MNLTKKQIDELNLELTLEIVPEDYEEAVRKKHDFGDHPKRRKNNYSLLKVL